MATPYRRNDSKGRQVMVVGRVSASAYTRQDGEPGASLEVTADTVRFLGGRDLDGATRAV